MPVKILIADDDLDIHQVVVDLLEINFRDVIIDKALNHESLMRKLRDPEAAYDLILLDYHLETGDGRDIIALLLEKRPELLSRIVLLNCSAESLTDDERVKHLPNIRKPFSLDYFSDVVKSVCTAN